MLITRKINIFSFFFRKPHAANNEKANSVSKAQNLDNTNLDELNKRFNVTRSQDFYKAQAFDVISPLTKLNR